MNKEEKQLLLKDLCARLQYGLKGQVVIEASTGEYDIYSGCLEYTDVDVDVELFGIEGEDITVYPIDDKYNDVISDYNYTVDDFLPYLRPLSSMTEEERKESREWLMLSFDREGNRYFDGFGNVSADDILKGIDWLNAHHFDYRGLINNGLALEAPEGLYK